MMPETSSLTLVDDARDSAVVFPTHRFFGRAVTPHGSRPSVVRHEKIRGDLFFLTDVEMMVKLRRARFKDTSQ
jgi:hypothetical protein